MSDKDVIDITTGRPIASPGNKPRSEASSAMDDAAPVRKTPVGGHKQITEKQREFAKLIVKGTGKTESYRQVYRTGAMTTKQVWQKADNLTKVPKVEGYIETLKQSVDGAVEHEAGSARTFIFERLYAEARNMGNRASERLRAVELLGKLASVGAFVDKSEIVVDNRPVEEVQDRIDTLLAKARRGAES